MKVLFVLNATGGGASQGIYEFLKSQQFEELKPYVLIPTEPDEKRRAFLNEYCTDWTVLHLNWWNKKHTLPWSLRTLLFLKEQLRSLFRIIPTYRLVQRIKQWDIDLVYTGTILNLEGAIAAKLSGKKHIWHIKETFGSQGRVQFRLSDRLLTRLLLGLSDRVIVMTDYIKSFFGKAQGHPKITVIYDGVNQSDFDQPLEIQALRQKLGISDTDIMAAMIASLSSTWKNHQLVLQIAASLQFQYPQLKFAAFGPLPKKTKRKWYNQAWEYYQGLKRIEQELGLTNFIWAGFHRNIPQMMQAADILVHPCETEPFGRISIEAQAAGTPVVGPDVGGIAESVVDQETGLLAPANAVDDFGEAIIKLVESPELRQKLGRKGQEHVGQNFSQTRHNQELFSLLKILINPPSKRS